MGVRKIFLIPRFDFYPGEPLFYINRIKNFLWSSLACAQAPRFPAAGAIVKITANIKTQSIFFSGTFFLNLRKHIKTQFLLYLIIY